MTDSPVLELQPQIEAALPTVQHSIADRLKLLPNVDAEVDGQGHLQVNHQKRIDPVSFGVINEKSQKSAPTNQSKEQMIREEARVGQAHVSAVARLLRDHLENPSHYIISTESGLEVKNNDILWRALGQMDYHSATEHAGRDRDRATRKGLPLPVVGAVAAATLKYVKSTVDQAVTQEAEGVDDQYIASIKAPLQVDINQLREQITTAKARAVECAGLKDRWGQSVAEQVVQMEPVKQAIATTTRIIIEAVSDPISADRMKDYIRSHNGSVDLLAEEGLFSKRVTHSDLKLQNFDTIVGDVILPHDLLEADKQALLLLTGSDQLNERTALLHLIGYTVKTEYLDKSKTTPTNLMREATTLLGEINSDWIPILKKQMTLFEKLAKTQLTEATNIAIYFYSRALALTFARDGVENKTRQKINSSTPIAADFQQNCSSRMNESSSKTQAYKQRENLLKKAQAEQQTANQILAEAQGTSTVLQRNLEAKQRQLSDLDQSRRTRIQAIKTQLLTPLLTDYTGHQPNPKELHDLSQFLDTHYGRSQIYTDTVLAIIRALPKFIAGGTDRERAIGAMYDRRYPIDRAEPLLSTDAYPDFLPSLVSALLPQEYSTRETATALICALQRRCAEDERVRLLGGYQSLGDEQFTSETEYVRRLADQVLYPITKGAQVHQIPQTLPRVNYDAIAAEQKASRQPSVTLHDQIVVSYRALDDWVRQRFTDRDFIAALLSFLLHPHQNSDKKIIPRRELLKEEPRFEPNSEVILNRFYELGFFGTTHGRDPIYFVG